MSTRYLEILAVQSPFPIGEDDNSRVVFSANYRSRAAYPVSTFEEDIYSFLYSLNLIGGLGNTTFIGPRGVIPNTGPGPYTEIIRTSGTSPDETHNGDKYENLTLQIIVRAQTYTLARNTSLAIWRALDGQRDLVI